jgi:hypothetical protein
MKKSLKTLVITVCAALPFFAMSTQAQTTKASCEADAKAQNIVGSAKDDFMKACLPEGYKADKAEAPAKSKKAMAKSKTKGKAKAKAKSKSSGPKNTAQVEMKK